MRNYTTDEIAKILAAHAQWLAGKPEGIRADLRKADLQCADLQDAKVNDKTKIDAVIITRRQIVPKTGSFIAYKKLRDGLIATLYVPSSARRIGGLVSRKCRVSKVKVKRIQRADGTNVERGMTARLNIL